MRSISCIQWTQSKLAEFTRHLASLALTVSFLSVFFPHSEYPEYYEQIKYPMDLATVKSKINEYSSVGEALADLRAIWNNCRAFNAEGSDILSSAENCSAVLEAFVQVRFCGI